MKRFLRRILSLFTSKSAEQDLAREVDSHLGLLEDEHRRRGLTPDEARLAARRALGSVAHAKDLHRDARSFRWLDDLRQDVRHALRSLRRTPGFTAIAVLTLALGIGANTAIFSVVHAVLLTPLPYAESERLVRLIRSVPDPAGPPRRGIARLSAAEIDQLRSYSRTLSHVGTAGLDLLNMRGRDPRLQGAEVSSDILQMLGARPLLGRVFRASDEAPGADRVLLLSYGAWQRHFGGAPDVVGRTVTFDAVLGPPARTDYTVVGVMPATFEFPNRQTQVWRSSRLASSSGGRVNTGPMLGRLADGVSLEAAAAEVVPLLREIRRGVPDNTAATYELVREQDELVEPVRPALLVLTAAVGLVLLIACVNVANLLVTRTAGRRREIAIRGALGAGRGRLIRHLLTESVLLALVGGVAGTLLAFGGVRVLQGLATTVSRLDIGNELRFPRLDEVGIDASVLAFAIAASLATGVVFGLAPAFRHARTDPARGLKEGAASSGWESALTRRTGARSLLIVAEIGIAMMLLVGSGLLIHSFVKLSSVDAGYDPANVLTFQVALPVERYPSERLKTFAEDLVTELRSVPGVQAAAYANQLPMVNIINSFALRDTPFIPPPGQPPQPPPEGSPDGRLVSRDYLKVMGIRVIAGRGFIEADGPGQPGVILVNEALARRDFAGQTPLGRIVYIGRDPSPWEIVGIVSNVRQFGLDREPQPQFFADLRQWSQAGLIFPAGAYYAARTSGDPTALTGSVRGILSRLDPEAVLFYVAPMKQLVSSTISRPRVYAVLLGVFSLIGVGVAAIGIYGVMAYSVAQRTREIGIRIALGASRSSVLTLVLGQAMALTMIGVGLGVLGGAGLTRYLEGMLFGLTPLDPLTFAGTSLMFVLVAALAALVPARRAVTVSPLTALRFD